MPRMFGTDGVRGLANRALTAQLALDLGDAAVRVLGDDGDKSEFDGRRRALVGRDTRVSGDFLAAALSAGMSAGGFDVIDAGIIPTPGVAYLTSVLNVEMGAVISASHNPMPDNGIKFFARGGFKLPDTKEDEIESVLGQDWERPTGAGVGRISHDTATATNLYIDHLVSTIAPIGPDKSQPTPLKGLKVVADCANGATSVVAPEALRRAGADVIVINASPDGYNINKNAGSTHPEQLQAPEPFASLARQSSALSQLPSLPQHPLPATPPRLSVDVPGRKWQQIQAFASHLSFARKPQHWLDWCAGKGHLGRLLASDGSQLTCLEWDPQLVASGQQLSQRAGINARHQQQDVLAENAAQHLHSEHCPVALHACGDLHVRLLKLASQAGCQQLAVAPCCYNRIRTSHYQAMSQTAKASHLQLSLEDLRLPLSETVTAGARVRRQRDQSMAWRPGFDLLQRELRQCDEYLHTPSLPGDWLHKSFAQFCLDLAALKGIPIIGGGSSWNGRLSSIGVALGFVFAFTALTFALVETRLGRIARDRYGLLAENVSDVNDLWTFARDSRSRDPNWKLIATESEQ